MSFWYQRDACSNNRHAGKQLKLKTGHGAFVLLSTCAVAAMAQDGVPPGLVATFDITQQLEYSDNPDLDTDAAADGDFYGRTILGFGLASVTTLEDFRLNIGTDLEEGRNDQSSVDLTNSFLDLSYERDTRNALFGFGLRYRETDTSSSVSDDDFLSDGDVINQDNATRESYGFDLRAEVGREAPIGASVRWSNNEISYSDTNDPDLTDTSTDTFDGQVDFRIDPRITASLTGKYIDFDTQGNGVNRETTGIGTALRLELSKIYTVNLGLGYDRIERSGDQIGTDEGFSGSIDVLRAMPNGDLGLRYTSDVASNVDGRRSFLGVRRNMELPRGQLSFQLGVTGTETVGTDPLLEASYSHILPSSRMTFSLEQSVLTDDDNQDQINATLRASYDREINSLSSMGVSLSLFNRNELQESNDDGQRVDLNLTYRYDMTRDWGMVSSFSHVISKAGSAEDRTSNTVFIGLQRSFDWRP